MKITCKFTLCSEKQKQELTRCFFQQRLYLKDSKLEIKEKKVCLEIISDENFISKEIMEIILSSEIYEFIYRSGVYDNKDERKSSVIPKAEENPEAEASAEENPEAEASAEENPEAEASAEENPEAEASAEENPEAEASAEENPEAEASAEENPEAEASAEENPEAEASTEENPEAEASTEENPDAEASAEEAISIDKKLEEVAENSPSFNSFVESVLQIFDLTARRDEFLLLIKAANELDKITWNNLIKTVSKEGVRINTYAQHFYSKKLSEISKQYSDRITILLLIKKLNDYHQYFEVRAEGKDSKPDEEGKTEEAKGEGSAKARIRMQCIPVEIPFFEEGLASIDKTETLEVKLEYVFKELMGLENTENQYNQSIILKIIKAVATMKEVSNLQQIVQNTTILPQKRIEACMIFSTFINAFVERYSGKKSLIPSSEFLKELKDIIR